jgi:Uma2 family endonuclease
LPELACTELAEVSKATKIGTTQVNIAIILPSTRLRNPISSRNRLNRSDNMREIIDFEDEVLEDEGDKMGSIIHSGTQAMLTGLLLNNNNLSVFTELSLDIRQHDLSKYRLKVKDELKPDVCAYVGAPPMPNEEFEDDLLSVSQMPELAIEVLSPNQSIGYLIRKIKAYFALGIKSCWLVMPPLEEVRVFSQPRSYKTFDVNHTELVDEVMDIRLPIQKIFKRYWN